MIPPIKNKSKYAPEFKAKVAIAALMSGRSLQELSAIYLVHPSKISQWKHQLIDRAEFVFQMNSAFYRNHHLKQLDSHTDVVARS